MLLNLVKSCRLLEVSSLRLLQTLGMSSRRQANEVAHALARVAPFSASPTIYIDVFHCIERIIINEML
jgi:hypothetical protein